jgi:hypothetical protein
LIPDVPITELMPMIGQVRGHYADVRLAGAVLLSTSLLAVLLSALGLYGVIAVRRCAAHSRSRDSHGAGREAGRSDRDVSETGTRVASVWVE